MPPTMSGGQGPVSRSFGEGEAYSDGENSKLGYKRAKCWENAPRQGLCTGVPGTRRFFDGSGGAEFNSAVNRISQGNRRSPHGCPSARGAKGRTVFSCGFPIMP